MRRTSGNFSALRWISVKAKWIVFKKIKGNYNEKDHFN